MCNVEGPPLRQSRPGPMPSGDPLPIYLDYNATSPIGQPALDALTYHASRVYGNPSSAHPYGLEAKYCVERARETIRSVLGIPHPTNEDEPPEVIFTSGGTESNNLAIFGTINGIKRQEEKGPAKKWTRRSIISTNFEHPAVDKVLQSLECEDHYQCKVFRCPVNSHGRITAAELRSFLGDCVASKGLILEEVALFTMVWCSGEIGTVLPIADLVTVSKELCPNSFFHTDGAQGFGKVPLIGGNCLPTSLSDPTCLPLGGVDMLSICGHKFYAPKGSGALYVRKHVPLANIAYGADHEKGKRPGTENILFNTAIAAALKYAVENQPQLAAHTGRCRNVLYQTLNGILKKEGFAIRINGNPELMKEAGAEGENEEGGTLSHQEEVERIHATTQHTLPNTLNCSIRQLKNKDTGFENTYISAARLIEELGHVMAMSAGSACHSKVKPGEKVHVSGTLLAIGCTQEEAIGTLRLSCGKNSTPEEMSRAGRFLARRSMQQVADW